MLVYKENYEGVWISVSKNCKSTFSFSNYMYISHLISYLNIIFFVKVVTNCINNIYLMKDNK
jgi:hypothetical protein